jgi:multisubunit Na+/H+ antiporter MnhF subunit
MNAWQIAVVVLMVPFCVGGWACCRGSVENRLVGLMFGGEIATLVFLALAAASHRGFYIDCALATAILPYPASIVFAHYFEQWL